MANGFPLGATAARRELMEKWGPASHGSTFGGSPISCAAALATLEVIREENLLEKARVQGTYMLEQLAELQAETRIIGDVRGVGLMVAVEFIRPRANKEPGTDAVRHILQRSLDGGLLTYPCGHWSQTIRLIPPLTITREQVDEGLAIFRQAVLAEAG
jgi:4-aminobutyrate aminotransferase